MKRLEFLGDSFNLIINKELINEFPEGDEGF